jgi:hypothetical protein
MPDFEGDLRFYIGLASLATMAILSFLVVFISLRGIRRSWLAAVADSNTGAFPDREPLTLDQFYEQFYSGEQFPRATVLETLTHFAAAAHVPASYLKPDDILQQVGAKHPQDCERFITDTAMLLQDAEQSFGVSLFSGQLLTLDDYIRVHVLAARLVRKTSAAQA